MLYVRILKLFLECTKNLGLSIPFHTAFAFILLEVVLKVLDLQLPDPYQSILYGGMWGLSILTVICFLYGYLNSKWVRRAVGWIALIEKYKNSTVLDPDWENHENRECPHKQYLDTGNGMVPFSKILGNEKNQELADLKKKIRDIQARLGLVTGAVSVGSITLAAANERCKHFIAEAEVIIEKITEVPGAKSR